MSVLGEGLRDFNIVGVNLSTRKANYDVIQLLSTGKKKLITAARFASTLGVDFDEIVVYYKNFFTCVKDRCLSRNAESLRFNKLSKIHEFNINSEE